VRALALTLGLLGACTSPATIAGPEATLRAYTEALREGDARKAYGLLDPDTREAVSFERFARTFEENRAELQEQARQVEDAVRSGEVQSRAAVELAEAETAVLTLEEGRWTILGGVLDAPALQTPRDAVLALRHAVQRRSLRGLMRVLAREPRAGLEDERRRFLDETADPLDLEVDIQGNRARVRLTGGRVILLVREAGEWRVVDVE
jgi:hypothetical protein